MRIFQLVYETVIVDLLSFLAVARCVGVKPGFHPYTSKITQGEAGVRVYARNVLNATNIVLSCGEIYSST